MKRNRIVLLLLMAGLLLSGCGKKTDPGEKPEPTPTPTEVVVQPPEPSPTPTPTPTPTPSPTPTPVPGSPTVTLNPTDVTVAVGGSCSFEANYENAIWATWHFESPDGQTDYDYGGIWTQFPYMQVLNGMYSNMQLNNVPEGLNGWKVYCRYTNDIGSADTQKAKITVTGTQTGTGNTGIGGSTGSTSAASGANAYGGFSDIYVDEYNEMNMVIEGDSNWYDVTITWPYSSEKIITWKFGGTFNDNGVMRYDNCTKILYEYDDQDSEKESYQYDGGSGELEFQASRNGMVITSYMDGDEAVNGVFFGRG